jgi:DNA-directed RNA polymerase specialized sigma24 family protein
MREEQTGAETSRSAEDDSASRLFDRIAGRLTGKQKAAFVLREMEDLDTSEIAVILACGESTVRNHLFNARKILRREIARVAPSLAGPGAKKS